MQTPFDDVDAMEGIVLLHHRLILPSGQIMIINKQKKREWKNKSAPRNRIGFFSI